MPSLNQRDYIGWIKNELLVNSVRCWLQFIAACAAASRAASGFDMRKDVRLGELPSKFCRETLVDRERCKEIQLICESHPGFIDKVWADRPYIGHLRIIAAYVAILAVDRAQSLVKIRGWIVAVGFRDSQPVVRCDVEIQTTKIFNERIAAGWVVEVIVCNGR